ncbi:MAG: hypothetical protein F9K19_08435 [Rhizobiaceae bacterium]|nr:MAG: hypothetical protein F9K19_08435 [Rhizobiaceae bacterium]CAG0973155.1 hypothetical protein RHIZO_01334 [Rhizobiaceae bacterium]
MFAGATLFLLGISTGGSAAQSNTRVYLFRGFAEIFSTGMDQLAADLRKAGIDARVHSYVSWSSVVAGAAADYAEGRVKKIIVVGHSMGAGSVTATTMELGKKGVPVRLAITIDGLKRRPASGSVIRFVNYYIANGGGGQIVRGAGFRGSLANVNVDAIKGISHLNIDSNPAVQSMIKSEIRSAL